MSLSARKEFSGDADGNVNVTKFPEDPVPQQLKEVVELISSVNRRLEDCAVEWQSTVSRKQWRILDGKSGTEKPWEHSLLARTYFTEKILDDAFQCLLAKDRIFTEQLNNFIGLLRGDETSVITANVRDAQNQFPELQFLDGHGNNYPLITPLDLSLLENRGNIRKTRKSKRLATENTIATIQQSFGDLVKAKINLDTKFLGFEAMLNGSNELNQNNGSTNCLCQICSNVLGNAVEKGNVMKRIASVRQKAHQRVTRAQTKRLTKSTRTWTRRKPKNQTISLDDINDEGTMITARSYRESIMD